MGSTGSVGRVMGALWALAGTGLSAWKGFSGESHGEDVDEENEETFLDSWLSASGGERSRCGAVSAEGGDVIDRGDKRDKCKVQKVNRSEFSNTRKLQETPRQLAATDHHHTLPAV